MRKVRLALLLVMRYAVMALCGAASVFVLSSGYESVYSRSLPYVHTVDPVDLSSIGQTAGLPAEMQALAHAPVAPKRYGQFGKPAVFKMPGASATVRLDIADPISHGSAWLARPTTLHAILPQPAKNGNISLLVLYCRASFRTVDGANLPAEGANIFIDTDQKWRYVYKVASARAYRQDEPYVMAASQAGGSTSGKLLLDCNDRAKGVSDIIEADLLSVQGAEL